MRESTQPEIFKTLAGRLVGNWYDHYYRHSFIFSFCGGEIESADVQVSKGKQIFMGTYQLNITMNDAARIVMTGLPDAFESVIKVITDDTLILQRRNGNLSIPNSAKHITQKLKKLLQVSSGLSQVQAKHHPLTIRKKNAIFPS